MINSFSTRIKRMYKRNYKNILVILFVIFNSLLVNGQSFWTYSLNPRCDSSIGFFYFNVGYISSGKFYAKDIRDFTANGFYFQNSKFKSNIFIGDTIYTFIRESNDDFINMLDSLKIKYPKFGNPSKTIDSLINKYLKHNMIIIKCDKKRSINAKLVFVKLKMKIIYNESYIKQSDLSNKYCFTANRKMTTCTNNDFFYKPILNFEILRSP